MKAKLSALLLFSSILINVSLDAKKARYLTVLNRIPSKIKVVYSAKKLIYCAGTDFGKFQVCAAKALDYNQSVVFKNIGHDGHIKIYNYDKDDLELASMDTSGNTYGRFIFDYKRDAQGHPNMTQFTLIEG